MRGVQWTKYKIPTNKNAELIAQKGELITGTKDDGIKVQFDNFVISLNKLKYDNKDYYVILTE